MLFMSCACHAFASVHCCLVVTCWERADLLALVCDVYCGFVTFQCGILGQMQGWKILKFFTRPTSPYVLVNSIINIGNSQNFYSSYSIRHSPGCSSGFFQPLGVVLDCIDS